jgi:hypothetical protein
MEIDGDIDPNMTPRERVESLGYSFDEDGYEKYAADTSYHDADIAFGMIPAIYRDEELVDREEPLTPVEQKEQKSPLEIVLARHGVSMTEFDQRDHNMGSIDSTLMSFGISVREYQGEVDKASGKGEKRKRKVGGAATRRAKRSKPKTEEEPPF